MNGNQWRRCSACKQPIAFGSVYWVCNVSTCNRKRTGLAFCTVTCWEVHLPEANHRESWAVEKVAARSSEAKPERSAPKPAARERIIRSAAPTPQKSTASKQTLIIGSRLKEYIRERSGLNTSDRVLGPLSDVVRRVCDEAIRNAERAERKTVLDRDVPGI